MRFLLLLAIASFVCAAAEPASSVGPAAATQAKVMQRWSELRGKIMARQSEGVAAVADELDKSAHILRQEFPAVSDTWGLMQEAAQLQAQAKNYTRASAIAKEIAESPDASAQLKQMAKLMSTRYGYVGKTIDFKFTSLDGKEVDFAKLRGKVVFVDFWASWCGPCKVALPEIKETHEKLKNRGFEVIGINLDEKEEAMRAAVKEFSMTWPVRYDGQGVNGTVGQRFGIMGIPSMWLLDRKGVVRDIREGVPRGGAKMGLEAQVTALLDEKE